VHTWTAVDVIWANFVVAFSSPSSSASAWSWCCSSAVVFLSSKPDLRASCSSTVISALSVAAVVVVVVGWVAAPSCDDLHRALFSLLLGVLIGFSSSVGWLALPHPAHHP
jgi:hypothetical protein